MRHARHSGQVRHASTEWLITRGLSIAGILLLFVGWSLGGDGIGHDIAEDRGAFLLTRPRARRFFVWADSGFSFGLMAALAWGTDAALRYCSAYSFVLFHSARHVSPLASCADPAQWRGLCRADVCSHLPVHDAAFRGTNGACCFGGSADRVCVSAFESLPRLGRRDAVTSSRAGGWIRFRIDTAPQ